MNRVDDCGCLSWVIESCKSDWAGKKILEHYLTGGGKKVKKHSKKWTSYMNKAPMCNGIACKHKAIPEKTLYDYIVNKILEYKDKVKYIGAPYSRKIVVKTQLQNGEGIIGYNYLHGVNMNAGGLIIEFTIAKQPAKSKKEKFRLKITAKCQWCDFIDANFEYATDKLKAEIAKKIPKVNPKDYKIVIEWNLSKTLVVYKV